jgi:uncharacterized protein YdhG (YjbR/CyaY superfamily)
LVVAARNRVPTITRTTRNFVANHADSTAKANAPAPKDVDEYLSRLPEDQRVALQNVRDVIRAAAPEAIETMSYQIPTYRYHGPLISFGAWKEHCALYGGTNEAFQDELRPYDTSKGTIRFRPESPLPADLVRRLILARMAGNDARHRK